MKLHCLKSLVTRINQLTKSATTFQRYRFYRNIHVWGGLGAQLTALFVAEYIKKYHNVGRIRIIIHQDNDFDFLLSMDGNELKSISIGIKVSVKNDFILPKHNRPFNYSNQQIWSKKRKSLYTSLVINNPIRTQHLDNLLCFNPSFFQRNFLIENIQLNSSSDFLNEFISNLPIEIKPNKSTIVLHWRLGDLYLRSKKTSGNTEKLLKTILSSESFSNLNLMIFTDSPVDAKRIIHKSNFNVAFSHKYTIEDMAENTMKFMSQAINAEFFIGTNSKLTLWIAAMRCSLGYNEKTYIPKNLSREFRMTFPFLISKFPNKYDFT